MEIFCFMVMGGDRNDIVVLSLPCMDPGPASVGIVSNECAVAVAKADTLPGTINTGDPQCNVMTAQRDYATLLGKAMHKPTAINPHPFQ